MTKLREVIDTYQELERMHRLNMEMLEQLAITCQHLVSNRVEVPNSETLKSLISKAMALLDELHAEEPKVLQYQKLADEKKQPFRTDEGVPVPPRRYCYLFG